MRKLRFLRRKTQVKMHDQGSTVPSQPRVRQGKLNPRSDRPGRRKGCTANWKAITLFNLDVETIIYFIFFLILGLILFLYIFFQNITLLST